MCPWSPSWLTKYKLDTENEAIAGNAPIHIVHGESDELVPVSHARAIHDAINKQRSGRATFYEIDNGDHDMIFKPSISGTMKEILKLIGIIYDPD